MQKGLANAFAMPSLFALAKQELRFYLTEQGLESTVTPTLFRVRLLAVGIALSHVVFGFLMSVVQPQPFENLYLRAGLAALALVLVWQTYSSWLEQRIPQLNLARSFIWSIWLHLNLFSLWMYAMNGFNDIWLAYTCTSIMMSFFLMKWRQALNGLSMALIAAPLLAMAAGQSPHWPSVQHICTLTLATTLSLLYALAMGNAREQHLRQSLAITSMLQIHIHPHLLAMHALLERLKSMAKIAQPAASAGRLLALERVFTQSLKRMEHDLQMQRKNSQMLGLSGHTQILHAHALVLQTLAQFPFHDPKQERCVQVQVENDFAFLGDAQQWQQAISNLLKNAIDSLHYTKLHLKPGDLCIDIRTRGERGRISVLDHGLPISRQVLPHVFEPFYSEGPAAGLGLGLPFCQQLAQQAGGRIAIESDALTGTVVHIYLPIAPTTKSPPKSPADAAVPHPQQSKGQL